jgi:hypothetical protein
VSDASGKRNFLFGITLNELLMMILFFLLLAGGFMQIKLKDNQDEINALIKEKETIVNRNIQITQEKDEAINKLRLVEDVQEWIKSISPGVSVEEQAQIMSRLIDAQESKEQLDKAIAAASQQATTIEEMTNALKSCSVQRDDAIGQAEYANKQMEKCTGGVGPPPCWTTLDGRTEYLFEALIHQETITLKPAWPEGRQEAALSLPGVTLAIGNDYTLDQFRNIAKPIFDKSEEMECRFHVIIGHDGVVTTDTYVTIDKIIQEYFYPFKK